MTEIEAEKASEARRVAAAGGAPVGWAARWVARWRGWRAAVWRRRLARAICISVVFEIETLLERDLSAVEVRRIGARFMAWTQAEQDEVVANFYDGKGTRIVYRFVQDGEWWADLERTGGEAA